MNIEQLRKFCLAFPGVTENVKWGDHLAFCVGEKFFVMTGVDSMLGGVTLKCTPEKFAELTEREGIDPSAYIGRYKWVRISKLDAVTSDELKELIQTSYELVRDKLPASVRNSLS